MKKKLSSVFFPALALAAAFLMFGCASAPKLGTADELQNLLNKLPEVSIAGKNVKMQFGGDVWISMVDGKEFLAGTLTFVNNTDTSTLTLKQTHAYSTEQKPGIGGDVGWVKTPGPDIVLEYKKGPPETLTVRN
jgi:hypothetical protein